MLYNVVVIRNEEDLRKMVEVIFTWPLYLYYLHIIIWNDLYAVK